MPAPLGRRLLDAAVKPLHLLPPGLGIATAGGLLVAGLAPLAAAVGALSLGTWGAMVAWDLASPAPPPPAPPPPPDPLDAIASPELRNLLFGVQAAAARVLQRIEGHDGALSASLAEIQAECQDLLGAALDAARRGDAIVRMLGDIDPKELQLAAEDRASGARRAADPEVSRALQDAASAKERELQTWRELARLVERIKAELIAAEASLDELHARVARVMLDDPGEAAAGGPQVRRQISEMAERLHVLERSAEKTLREVR